MALSDFHISQTHGKNLKKTDIILAHKFDFCMSHSTIHQCHRVVDAISSCFQTGRFFPAVFLNIS